MDIEDEQEPDDGIVLEPYDEVEEAYYAKAENQYDDLEREQEDPSEPDREQSPVPFIFATPTPTVEFEKPTLVTPNELESELRFTQDDVTENILQRLLENVGNIFESQQVEQVGLYISKLEAENKRLAEMAKYDYDTRLAMLEAENHRLRFDAGAFKTFCRRWLVKEKTKKMVFTFQGNAFEQLVRAEASRSWVRASGR